MLRSVNTSLAIFAGMQCQSAMRAAGKASDPLFGELSQEHVQICPQNRGQILFSTCDQLQAEFPSTNFRLHANALVFPRHVSLDLSTYQEEHPYWGALIAINQALGNHGYSLHAGRHNGMTLAELFDNLKVLEDRFKCPVAVEGLYPSPENFFLSTWEEYAALLDADVHYAIDLSHLNIVAYHEGRYERDLTRELLSSPRCTEVHVSGNDGTSDQHNAIKGPPPVWMSDLEYCHPSTIIFSEAYLGNQHAH